MSFHDPNSHHFWKVLIYFFTIKKSAIKAHRMLSETYYEAAVSERTYR